MLGSGVRGETPTQRERGGDDESVTGITIKVMGYRQPHARARARMAYSTGPGVGG